MGDPDVPQAMKRLRAALSALLVLGGAAFLAPATPAGAGEPEAEAGLPLEVPDDPPDLSTSLTQATSAAATVTMGRFTSVQVNVDASGANILHDAANEPSIAVDPNDPSHIVIGWRQFDSKSSNFRQAGYGYSTNGGLTWTTGKIEAGVFRSDPVLGFDASGKFFYDSLMGNLTCWLFQSANGGATWSAAIPAYGGDKQWMTIDRTGGIGSGNVYEAWSTDANPTPPHTFTRSVDGGSLFQSPTDVPNAPIWGTLDVAVDGTLAMVGTSGEGGPIYVARSTSAQDPTQAPTFTTTAVDLGGVIKTGGPNPVGLLGQLWIAIDKSSGPRRGWIYVLASVQTPTDPLDVMFIRSTNGGQTWSTPRRVNDDPAGTRAFQWFGTMSVSPDGRIDAVWNDTRASADSTKSALYYSFSYDGGDTWSPNEQASPVWDSTVGWPKQNKIGDYYHMISRSDGADLAWAATFNGEQDVYYLRIPGGVTAAGEPALHPLRLEAATPNPFVARTAIHFEMPGRGGHARLAVFDPGGRRVASLVDGFVGGGRQSVQWGGTDDRGRALGSGLYLARLDVGGEVRTSKLMLLR